MEQVVDAPADKWLVCVLRQDRLAGLVPSAPEDRPGPQAALLAGRQEVAGLKTVPLEQIAEDGDERGGRGRGDIKSSRTVQPSCPPGRRLRRQRPRERRVHQRCSDSEFADLKRAVDVSRMPIGGYVAESSPAAARADGPTSAVADCRAVATTGPRAAAAGAVRGIDRRSGRRRRPSNRGAVSR